VFISASCILVMSVFVLIGICAHVLVFDLINSVGHCLLIYSSNKEKDMVGGLLPRLRFFFQRNKR